MTTTYSITVSFQSKFLFEITRFSEEVNVPDFAENLKDKYSADKGFEVILETVKTETTVQFISRPDRDTFSADLGEGAPMKINP